MSDSILAPDSLDALRQQRKLAEHITSSVWLAQTKQGQQVVVKTMQTPLFAFRVRQLFQQRLSLCLRVRHPHITPVYAGRLRATRQCVTVSAYAPRGSLYDAVTTGERRLWTLPLASGEALRLLDEIAAGTQALHDHHLLHGGLKLTNILLVNGADGVHAQITDALLHQGIAGELDPPSDTTPGVADPWLYLAPEQWQQHPQLASDQYALGMIAFVLLTGEAPYTRSPIAVARTPEPPVMLAASTLNPVLPEAVDAVLWRALHRQPRQRYERLGDFIQHLRATLGESESVRTLRLPAGSIPVTRGSERAEPVQQAHDALVAPVPVAVLGAADSANTDLPALPPQYTWTAEVVAAHSTRMPTPGTPSPSITRRAERMGNTVLVTAIMIVLLLIALLSALLALSVLGH